MSQALLCTLFMKSASHTRCLLDLLWHKSVIHFSNIGSFVLHIDNNNNPQALQVT